MNNVTLVEASIDTAVDAQPSLEAASESLRLDALVWWHLLSLDAPSVAAVWTWFLARVFGVTMPWRVPAAMFVAVWMVYVADRLMDARAGDAKALEERHWFHHRYRRWFGLGLVGAGLGLLALLARFEVTLIERFAWLGLGLAGWFAVIHLGRWRRLPKEFAVGCFFAAAVTVPLWGVWARRPAEMIVCAVLMASLFSLNCLLIDVWEHPGWRSRGGLRWLALGVCAAAVGGVIWWPPVSGVMTSVGVASGLLLLLERMRGRLEATTLRAAADLVLLTPLLVVGWMAFPWR